MTKTKLIGLRAYSRHRGCSLSAVQKAVKNGRITLQAGKIDVSASDKRWSEYSANRQDEALRAPAAGRGARERRAIATRPPQDEGVVSYASARAEREHYRAKRERIEFERDSGLVADVAEFRIKFGRLVTEAKNRLMSVPSLCKGRIPQLSGIDVSIIENLIREALEDLADAKTETEQ